MFDSYIVCDSCSKPYPSYLISYKGGTEVEHDDVIECDECFEMVCHKCAREHLTQHDVIHEKGEN